MEECVFCRENLPNGQETIVYSHERFGNCTGATVHCHCLAAWSTACTRDTRRFSCIKCNKTLSHPEINRQLEASPQWGIPLRRVAARRALGTRIVQGARNVIIGGIVATGLYLHGADIFALFFTDEVVVQLPQGPWGQPPMPPIEQLPQLSFWQTFGLMAMQGMGGKSRRNKKNKKSRKKRGGAKEMTFESVQGYKLKKNEVLVGVFKDPSMIKYLRELPSV